jgi:hypothetical protein
MGELKPCPLCGRSDWLGYACGREFNMLVKCLYCGTRGPEADEYADKAQAAERWNRRAVDAELEG